MYRLRNVLPIPIVLLIALVTARGGLPLAGAICLSLVNSFVGGAPDTGPDWKACSNREGWSPRGPTAWFAGPMLGHFAGGFGYRRNVRMVPVYLMLAGPAALDCVSHP